MTTAGSLWLDRQPLLLASASAIRRKILRDAGIPVDALAAQIDERAVEAGLAGRAPSDIATALAGQKAVSVAASHPGRLVLGADQTLALGARTLHKPGDMTQAAEQLAEMSGKQHQLHAALALARDGQILWRHVETATITFRPFGQSFIARYLDAGGDAVLSSVGVYQIEALGPHLFERIEGDHTTIMGLPLIALLHHLRTLGFVAE